MLYVELTEMDCTKVMEHGELFSNGGNFKSILTFSQVVIFLDDEVLQI